MLARAASPGTQLLADDPGRSGHAVEGPMRDPQATTRRHAMRSVREAARDAGVPEVTLRRWIAEGELFAVRLGPTALVDLGEVVAVRDRLTADVPPRRMFRLPPGVSRTIGAGDLVVGILGFLA